MKSLPKSNDFTNEQLILLCRLDPEVIDFEYKNGTIFPVVRAYDNLLHQIWLFCIHCNDYHYHGRGGRQAPFELGRGGNAGHRVAHCTTVNSPFSKNGYILDVVAKINEMPKHTKRRGNYICAICGKSYSAAFNTCSCGFFRNTNKNNQYSELSELYRNIYNIPANVNNYSKINISQKGVNNGIVAGILQAVAEPQKKE